MAKVALLIGISEYDEPTLARLPNAVHDVEAMERVLRNPEMGGFAAVKVLKNPQRQEMTEAIEELYITCGKGDLVLFYFSGHGVTTDNGDFYFSTRITRKDGGKLRTATAVAATTVHGWMNQSKSKRLVIILDCCFSGAFARGLTAKDVGTIDLQQQLGGEGRAILTASTSTQYAFESDDLDLSIYTHYLVEGIEKGAADIDGDGWIAVDELHDFAKSKVQEASPSMTPEFYPHKEGYRIFLAKSPKDDPQLKYRKEVEKMALEDEGEISDINRFYLDEFRDNLGLSVYEAGAIELEVLEPYRKRREKLRRYKQALSSVKQYPLSERDRNALERLQNILSLRDEDVAPIKQRILDQKQAEYQRQQQEAERLRISTTPNIPQQPISPKSTTNTPLNTPPLPSVSPPLHNTPPNPKPITPKSSTTSSSSPVINLSRRRVIQTVGFAGAGLGLTVVVLPLFRQNNPPKSPISLQTFSFQTAKVDARGNITSRPKLEGKQFVENLGNGVTLEMVQIPGGTFMMGSPATEKDRESDESPQHEVKVSSFFMGKYEVTQEQYQAVMEKNPANFKGEKRPAENVSWDDAVEFCNNLSQKTGRKYRLPSEAEWEYACRAGTTTPFYFGETITPELVNYNGNYPYGAAPKGEYREQTTEVGNAGKFPPNAFGLYDMCGNIWEWCQDVYNDSYQGAPTDGDAWLTGKDNNIKLLRGGSWIHYARDCRSAFRDNLARENRDLVVGFRVVAVAVA